MQQLDIRHDFRNHLFYADVEGGTAELEYDRFGDKFVEYKWTYVPEESRHEGVGNSLVEHALKYAAEHDLKVKPTCPFVKDVMDHHGEYRKLAYEVF